MIFQLFSDIHLDVNTGYKPIISPKADAVLFAGDCGSGELLSEFKYDLAGDNPETILVYTKGNHDYWGNSLKANRVIFGIEDIVVIACTFWTNFNNNCERTKVESKKYINDYRMIKNEAGTEFITPENIYNQHLEDLAWLNEQLEIYKDLKIVVMTHHSPSQQSIHKKFEGRENYYLNGSFCSDYDQLIINNPQIKLWCHGHCHNNFDYYIGTTRVVCNPKGYRDENPEYKEELLIEI